MDTYSSLVSSTGGCSENHYLKIKRSRLLLGTQNENWGWSDDRTTCESLTLLRPHFYSLLVVLLLHKTGALPTSRQRWFAIHPLMQSHLPCCPKQDVLWHPGAMLQHPQHPQSMWTARVYHEHCLCQQNPRVPLSASSTSCALCSQVRLCAWRDVQLQAGLVSQNLPLLLKEVDLIPAP